MFERFLTFCIPLTAFLIGLSACSQPVLESPECIASRDPVKRFYSFHFGNEMKPSKENLAERGKFLSQDLLEELSKQTETKKDYFTQETDYPKAFRAGKCETVSPDRARFEILLFWRTNDKNIQREIAVEAVREDEKWKIDRVTPKN